MSFKHLTLLDPRHALHDADIPLLQASQVSAGSLIASEEDSVHLRGDMQQLPSTARTGEARHTPRSEKGTVCGIP